jgi:hypothetical protein
VSEAGALGMLTLTFAADVASVIGETAALTGRPFGGNLVLGEAIAWAESGAPVARYSSALPLEGTTGDIAGLSLWAGQSVALARRTQSAAEIIAELTAGL